MSDYNESLGNQPRTSSRQNSQILYSTREKEFVELHEQVQTSVNLLDSLESFLSTFQKDLTAVSGQISELQDRSKDIDNRLKSRRKIEKPLSNLINDIVIPPSLATLILDSKVDESWLPAIEDFERHLEVIKARSKVKAARDLGEVVEGLRIVAATKLRVFFLSLFQPIRNSVTTNMQVMQTSILIKYQPLFAFLQRQAVPVAHEIQRSYVGAARVYYETGFRRYARSLGYIKARTTEKFETIVNEAEKLDNAPVDVVRLSNAQFDGPSVTLAYMADDKTHKEYVEALYRSLLLVFMDNATAEYTFVKMFFTVEATLPSLDSQKSLLSPSSLLSPTDRLSNAGSDYGGRSRATSLTIAGALDSAAAVAREEQINVDGIWKQVFDPVLEYVQTFVKTIIEPPPPVISLLTMIRLTEHVVTEIENRACPPCVTFMFGLRLQMWPIFQKLMNENIEVLKKLAEGSGGGYFSRAATVTEATVRSMCLRYLRLFTAFVILTEKEDETMIFSNLLRMRQEIEKLIQRCTGHTSDAVARATAQSAFYEILLRGLHKGVQSVAHPKSQHEIAYWARLEEEAKRKIISVQQARTRR
ncbi:vacuolar sorting protein [Rhodocollybia butyracea]|uniref:Vacuolar sorting protein n=1 Tax=Rhodocollybia butyracea TaxID=206335 RepID=A0A9P5UF16_9AGAR|nr:vacuolar sorting protein [Rhodocollybia butyracea]